VRENYSKKDNTTHKGQLGGKTGMNLVWFVPSFDMHCCVVGSGSPSPTPLSPDEKMIDAPRQPAHGQNEHEPMRDVTKRDLPRVANSLQTRTAYSSGTRNDRNEQPLHVSARRVRKYAAKQQSKATSHSNEAEGNIGSHQSVRRRCSSLKWSAVYRHHHPRTA
jgi:hypothetical protein